MLTMQGTDMIHAVITTKYHKYPSTTILNHSNILSKVNKLPCRCLLQITPHDAYSITIHVLTVTQVVVGHK